MKSGPNRTRRPWFTLLAVVLVVIFSLWLPVSTTAYGEGATPPCGSPLLNGIRFTSDGTFGGSTYSDWVSSSICAQARGERFVEIVVLAALLACLIPTVVVLRRRRRSLLDSDQEIFVAGGVIAALMNPVLGPLIGLVFAKQTGTRRMLVTQFIANLGLVAAIGIVGLGGYLGSDLPGYPSSFTGVAEISITFVLAGAPVAFPLSLLARPRRPSDALAANASLASPYRTQ